MEDYVPTANAKQLYPDTPINLKSTIFACYFFSVCFRATRQLHIHLTSTHSLITSVYKGVTRFNTTVSSNQPLYVIPYLQKHYHLHPGLYLSLSVFH